MRVLPSFCALAVLVAASSCAAVAPPVSPDAAWFPVIAGRTWTFEGRQGTDVSRGVFRLEAGDAPGTLTLVVENPKTAKTESARLRAEGEDVTIFWASGRFDLLRAPLESGRSWAWEEHGRRTEASVLGIETISVSGKPTSCLHVRYVLPGAPTQDYWFARGVGWVRIQMTVPGGAPEVRELAAP